MANYTKHTIHNNQSEPIRDKRITFKAYCSGKPEYSSEKITSFFNDVYEGQFLNAHELIKFCTQTTNSSLFLAAIDCDVDPLKLHAKITPNKKQISLSFGEKFRTQQWVCDILNKETHQNVDVSPQKVASLLQKRFGSKEEEPLGRPEINALFEELYDSHVDDLATLIDFVSHCEAIDIQDIGIENLNYKADSKNSRRLTGNEPAILSDWLNSEHRLFGYRYQDLPLDQFSENRVNQLISERTNKHKSRLDPPSVPFLLQQYPPILEIVRAIADTQSLGLRQLSSQLGTRYIKDLLVESETEKMNVPERRAIENWINKSLAAPPLCDKRDDFPSRRAIGYLLGEQTSQAAMIVKYEPKDISTLSDMLEYFRAAEYEIPTHIGRRKSRLSTLFQEGNGHKMNFEERQYCEKLIYDILASPQMARKRDIFPAAQDIQNMLDERTSPSVLNGRKTPNDVKSLTEIVDYLRGNDCEIPSTIGTNNRRLDMLIGDRKEKMSLEERTIVAKHINDGLSMPKLAFARPYLPTDEDIELLLDKQTAKSVLKARDTYISGTSPAAASERAPRY